MTKKKSLSFGHKTKKYKLIPKDKIFGHSNAIPKKMVGYGMSKIKQTIKDNILTFILTSKLLLTIMDHISGHLFMDKIVSDPKDSDMRRCAINKKYFTRSSVDYTPAYPLISPDFIEISHNLQHCLV